MAQLVKVIDGLAIASVKVVDGLAIASVKVVDGLDNTSGGGGQTINYSFTLPDGSDIGADWTPVDSSFKILSNVATASNGSVDAAEVYNAGTWTDNQSSECPITGVAWGAGAGVGYGPGVRWSTGAITGYRVVMNSSGNWEALKFIAGSSTVLGSGTTTYTSGQVLLISAIGTTILASYNGVTLGSWTDASIASGRPAITESSSTSGGGIPSVTMKDGL